MPNNNPTVTWLGMEMMRRLINKLNAGAFASSEYNKDFMKEFPVGETVYAKLPQRFLVNDGLAYQPQPLNRKNVPITCDRIKQVSFDYNQVYEQLYLERTKAEIEDNYIEPAMDALSQQIDTDFVQFAYQNTNNFVGILGTNPTSMLPYAQARQRMVENACPQNVPWGMLVSPGMNTSISTALSTVFNPQDESSRVFKKGYIKSAQNFDFYESMSLFSHTAGTWAGAVTTTGANQSGSSLIITATAGDTFNVGDVVSIALVNNVNPQTRRSTGSSKQFTVTQPLTAAGGGADVLQISPPIIGPGDQYQNVDSLPAALAALTLFQGTASPNGKSGINGLGLTKQAYAMVSIRLAEVESAEISKTITDPKTGISLSLLKMMDPRTREWINRIDCCYGFGALYPDNCAVRIGSLT